MSKLYYEDSLYKNELIGILISKLALTSANNEEEEKIQFRILEFYYKHNYLNSKQVKMVYDYVILEEGLSK